MRLGLRHEIAAQITETGCWLLSHAPRADGYVRVSVFGRVQYAHRYVYERLVDDIEVGLELDHKCRNRACVNPDHMEQVSHLENCRRGIPRCAKLTHCKHGHAFTADNIYHSNGRRHCRTCRIAYSRMRRARTTS